MYCTLYPLSKHVAYGTKWEWKFQNATPTNRLQIAAKRFELVLSFLLNGPHKTTIGILEILKIEILTIFFIFVNYHIWPWVTLNDLERSNSMSLRFWSIISRKLSWVATKH